MNTTRWFVRSNVVWILVRHWELKLDSFSDIFQNAAATLDLADDLGNLKLSWPLVFSRLFLVKVTAWYCKLGSVCDIEISQNNQWFYLLFYFVHCTLFSKQINFYHKFSIYFNIFPHFKSYCHVVSTSLWQILLRYRIEKSILMKKRCYLFCWSNHSTFRMCIYWHILSSFTINEMWTIFCEFTYCA